jgi:hypothetical protein
MAGVGPLSNLHFLEGELEEALQSASSDDVLVAIHACNEATKHVLDSAAKVSCRWAVMPCCVPKGLYEPHMAVSVSQETRYQLICGMIAARYGAVSVREINRTITDRNVLILGETPLQGSARK